MYEKLIKGKATNTKRLRQARKLLELACASGHLIDRPRPELANAVACATAAKELITLAIHTQEQSRSFYE